MLRYVLGDSTFFKALYLYASDTLQFKMKNSETDDFTQFMTSATRQDLSWFFDQWVKKPNHPVYFNQWSIDNVSNTVSMKITQTQPDPAFFKMPVQIKVSFLNRADSIIRFMDTVNAQIASFSFANKPIDVVFDPYNQIVLKKSTTVQVTSVHDDRYFPLHFSLEQNYPNPFNPETRFLYSIPQNRHVTLKIQDLLGRTIAMPIDQWEEAGIHSYEWNASSLPSGIYFYTLTAGHFSETRKLVLLK
jgi:hypothetical protein